MANYNFREDITVGERGEQVIVSEFEKNGMKFLNDNKDNKYDIKMETPSGKEVTFEVKTDVWCVPGKHVGTPFGNVWVDAKDNGNLFIEYQSRDKESGILTTKADMFIYYFPYYNEYWSISISDLKELIDNNIFLTTERSGDEGSDTRGYLIPREDYKESFKVFKIDYQWEK